MVTQSRQTLQFVLSRNSRTFISPTLSTTMNDEERKQLIIHLRMLLAARKTMLRNLDGLLSDAEINEALDQILKIEEEVKRLEKLN